jgi:hypothetical protein
MGAEATRRRFSGPRPAQLEGGAALGARQWRGCCRPPAADRWAAPRERCRHRSRGRVLQLLRQKLLSRQRALSRDSGLGANAADDRNDPTDRAKSHGMNELRLGGAAFRGTWRRSASGREPRYCSSNGLETCLTPTVGDRLLSLSQRAPGGAPFVALGAGPPAVESRDTVAQGARNMPDTYRWGSHLLWHSLSFCFASFSLASLRMS